MRSRYYIQNAIIIVLALAIISMSVGYATYSTNFTMNGVTRIQKSNWEVEFVNPQIHSSSTVPTENASNIVLTEDVNGKGDTVLSFDVTMGMGETYSFTIDVKNSGTFNAALSSYSLQANQNGQNIAIDEGVTSYSNNYLSYDVKWVDGSSLVKNQVINKNETKKLLVTVKTTKPLNDIDLPIDTETFNFTFQMNYKQI